MNSAISTYSSKTHILKILTNLHSQWYFKLDETSF